MGVITSENVVWSPHRHSLLLSQRLAIGGGGGAGIAL